ncbi:MAG: ABC transporter ATP-binding protein [Sulfolobales archaeon]|nr:ABC transporter ATP-binding protein [Sulfolobales archaeon]
MHLLEVENLTSGYGKAVVVNRVSFAVDRGQTIGIVGPNGAGKTTLIRTVLGYLKPSSGRVLYKGEDITGLPAYRIARLGIGYVPERGGIFRSLTVRENIELALSSSKFGRDRIREVVKLFKILEERENQIARTLSGGEQKMLSIAMAVLIADELMVLDEPSSGLAPVMRRKLVDTFKRVEKELGISLIVVEQDPTVILETADTVHVMEMGSIVKSGRAQDVIKPEVLKEHYLGA